MEQQFDPEVAPWHTALVASGAYTYAELAQLRGEDIATTRAWAERQPGVFTATYGGDTLVPGFIFDTAGNPRPELAPLIAEVLAAVQGPWQTWAWFTSPTSLLSGGVPADLASDPTQLRRVQKAAARCAALCAGSSSPGFPADTL